MAFIWHNLARLHKENGNLEAAIAAVNEDLTLKPDLKLYQNTLKVLEGDGGQE